MTKTPRYETWGTPSGRCGIQRTLLSDNEQDQAFLDAVKIVDEHGNERTPTTEEANAMGMRRIVASRNIVTGELKMREDIAEGTPIFLVRAGR